MHRIFSWIELKLPSLRKSSNNIIYIRLPLETGILLTNWENYLTAATILKSDFESVSKSSSQNLNR